MSNAVGFVLRLVPGRTPKNPASGLMAHRRPSDPGRIQAMSSPTVHADQPGIEAGGTSMAILVLPHAEGNAPAMYRTGPSLYRHPTMSMCSASQPSRFA